MQTNWDHIYSKFYSKFIFAGFADLPAAKACQFADCRGKGNYRQNGMYNLYLHCYLLHQKIDPIPSLQLRFWYWMNQHPDQHFLAFTVEQISFNSPKMIRSCCSWSGKGRSAASLHPTEQSTLTWCPANSCQSVVFLPPSELFSWRSVLRMRVLRYSTGGVCLGV